MKLDIYCNIFLVKKCDSENNTILFPLLKQNYSIK